MILLLDPKNSHDDDAFPPFSPLWVPHCIQGPPEEMATSATLTKGAGAPLHGLLLLLSIVN